MSKVDWCAPSDAEVREFVVWLNDLQREAAAIDVRSHCFRFDEERFVKDVREPLDRVLSEARRVVLQVSERCDPPETGDASLDIGADNWFAQGSALIPAAIETQLWKRVGDACFAARHELSAQGLTAAGQDRDYELARADSVRRRVRRALAVVVRALSETRGGAFSLVPPVTDDLESSIAVRAAYARFRRAVPRCEGQDPECVTRALRFCAVAFAVLFGSLEGGDLRVRDQRLLRSLQERLFAWAQGRRDTLDGLRLHQDISSTAELLRAINMRQELRANDALVVAAALANPPVVADESAVRRWIGSLAELRGREDELDRELIAAAAPSADPGARVEAIMRCLRELSATATMQAGTFF